MDEQWLMTLVDESWKKRGQPKHGLYPLEWDRTRAIINSRYRIGDASIRNDVGETERIPKNIQTLLKLSVHRLTDVERKAVLKTLNQLDIDYILLKQHLVATEFDENAFQRGYDLIPLLKKGIYGWVYTGVKKQSAMDGVNALGVTASLAFFHGVPDDDYGFTLTSRIPAKYQCTICLNDAVFANMHFMKSFCTTQCHDLFLDSVSL